MRIYTDTLTEDDLYQAADVARTRYGQDIYVNDSLTGNSRKRARRLEVHCASLSGRYATNSGNGGAGYDRAATWDAWGYFIAELFNRDPDAIIGYYASLDEFRSYCEDYVQSPYLQARPGTVFKREHTGAFLESLV